TLRAYGGGVGTAEAAVRIDSDRAVRVTAVHGIYLEETAGDLKIDLIASAEGEVVAAARTGSILSGGSANPGALCGAEGSCFLLPDEPPAGFYLCNIDNSC